MTTAEAAHYLRENDDYLILTHVNPDGDTLGSAAALCLGLRALGKRAFVAHNPGATGRFKALVEQLAPENGESGVIVSVDTADTSQLPDVFSEYIVDLSVDHHPGGGRYAKLSLSDTVCAAAGELVFLLLLELGVEITPDIAKALYIAIVTDSGCFRYESSTPRTLRVAAELMEAGAPAANIISELFEKKPLSRLRLESELIRDAELLENGLVSVMRLTAQKKESSAATADDLDNLASLTRMIDGVKVGILLIEEPEGVTRVSLRTMKGYNAGEICASLGGGGHARAAGCNLKMPMERARDTVLSAIKPE